MGTPNREPQEYSRNITEYKDPGRYSIFLLHSYYILGVPCLGIPIKVPLLSETLLPHWVIIHVVLGLYKENGKDNGN